MGDKSVGLQARLMSQAMRKLTGSIAKTRTCCIFINQTRAAIGNMYGPAQTTTGGNALKFYSTVRLKISPSSMIKDSNDKPIGKVTKVRVVKNKVAPPFQKTEFDIMFGEGISKTGEIIDYGEELGIIKKSGSWYSYDGSKIGQGKEAVRCTLNDNPELMEELEDKVREALSERLKSGKRTAPSTISKGGDEDDEYEEDSISMAAEDDNDFFEEDIEIEV